MKQLAYCWLIVVLVCCPRQKKVESKVNHATVQDNDAKQMEWS